MFLYDYHCKSCGENFESFSSMQSRDEPKSCPSCMEPSDRVQSKVRFKLEGITGHFPTAYDRWANIHEKEAKRVVEE